MAMRLFGSMAVAVTGIETSYISHSHCTCLPASSRPLLLVNQNFVVMSGLTKASNTSATGLRISMPVSEFGTRASWRLLILPPYWLYSIARLFDKCKLCGFRPASFVPYLEIASSTSSRAINTF
jgi:hypothetical protein